jgi:hypothetical protein
MRGPLELPPLPQEPKRVTEPTRRTAAAARAPVPASAANVGASLVDFLEKEEAKVGRAIVDTARQELQQQIGTGNADGRAVERR